MASAAKASKKTKSPTANKNYATRLADGRSVTVKDGVKTYSDKPLQVKGKGGISISGKDYSVNKGGTGFDTTITSDTIKNTPEIKFPPKPQVDNLTSLTDSINSSLATGSQGAYTYDKTTGFVNTPQPEKAPDSATSLFQQYLGAMDTNQANQFNAVAETKAMQKELRPKENLVNSYQNQLNQITAQRDAQQLGLEGQGRGQTSGFLGGEQARIGREAAIAAMPIQAQLAAAQDDLESARSYVSQLYTAKQADAQAKYQYQASKIQAIYGFLTAQEAKVARAKELEQSRAYQVEDRNLSLASNLAQTAMEFGQSSLAGKIMALDEKSPTFQADLAALQGQVRKPVAASGVEAPKVVSINGVDSIWNPKTGQFEPASVGDSSNLKPVKDLEIRDLNDTWTAKNSIVSIIDDMTKSIEDNGTKIFWGSEAGKRGANKTNLLLAMKNLEKTGALDKGTIDVLSDLIPENKFWATEDRQISSLNQLKDSIVGKTDEFVGSYRGTTAETDPRTQRIYKSNVQIDKSLFMPDEFNEVYSLFGVSATTPSGAFSPDDWLK